MLIADRDTRMALRTVRFTQRIQATWPRFLLTWGTLFQLAIAATLALAPYSQLLTPGTRPVLDLASRYVWAVLFLCAALLTATSPWLHSFRRLLAWVLVMGLGGVWLTAFCINVLHGGGSAIGVVAWVFLYVPLAAVALNTSLTGK